MPFMLGPQWADPNNIIASTRNINAHNEVEAWNWNWGTAAPNSEFGVTLWEDGEIEASFCGADEIGLDDDDHGHGGPELEQITAAGLMKSQGQIAFVDGSAKQSNNADLARSVEAMMNSRGGTTKYIAPFATRPFLEDDHHGH